MGKISKVVAFIVNAPVGIVYGAASWFSSAKDLETMSDKGFNQVAQGLGKSKEQLDWEREHCVDFRTGKPQC